MLGVCVRSPFCSATSILFIIVLNKVRCTCYKRRVNDASVQLSLHAGHILSDVWLGIAIVEPTSIGGAAKTTVCSSWCGSQWFAIRSCV